MEFSVSTESNHDSIIAKNGLLGYALALSRYECLKCNPALSMSGLFSWILALPSKNKAVCSCINKACDKHTTLKNIPGKCFKKKKQQNEEEAEIALSFRLFHLLLRSFKFHSENATFAKTSRPKINIWP